MKFSFFEINEKFFTYTFESTESTILKNALPYSIFNNMSQLDNWLLRHADGIWTDENKRPLACELEYGCVESSELLFGLAEEAHFWNL
jgi:hypothetical protein